MENLLGLFKYHCHYLFKKQYSKNDKAIELKSDGKDIQKMMNIGNKYLMKRNKKMKKIIILLLTIFFLTKVATYENTVLILNQYTGIVRETPTFDRDEALLVLKSYDMEDSCM